MKGRKFYLMVAGLLLIGFGAVYLFRQKQAEQLMAFEAYEIESVEARVSDLYNEDRTDLQSGLSAEKLTEMDKLLETLKSKTFSSKNKQRLEAVKAEFLTAKEMHQLEKGVESLFIEPDIIKKDISLREVEKLETEALVFQEKTVYYQRNMTALVQARTQIKAVEQARRFIESLFEGELVYSGVTRADEEKALELIKQIKNKEVREELLARAEILSAVLTEAEAALALEEELAKEAARQEEAAAEQPAEELEIGDEPLDHSAWNPAPFENPTVSGNSENVGTTWQPPRNSSNENHWTALPLPPAVPPQDLEEPSSPSEPAEELSPTPEPEIPVEEENEDQQQGE